MIVEIEVFKNRFVMKYGGEAKTLIPEKPFSTNRILIGDFIAAENCLVAGAKEMRIRRFPPFLSFMRPVVHFFPKELNEGGLSPVEKRTLYELGFRIRAKEVVIQ